MSDSASSESSDSAQSEYQSAHSTLVSPKETFHAHPPPSFSPGHISPRGSPGDVSTPEQDISPPVSPLTTRARQNNWHLTTLPDRLENIFERTSRRVSLGATLERQETEESHGDNEQVQDPNRRDTIISEGDNEVGEGEVGRKIDPTVSSHPSHVQTPGTRSLSAVSASVDIPSPHQHSRTDEGD
ncbi:hypothetical protein M8818_002299 [Zalaria obscura]|uniref:Uncharacterized protein n=1 Tax=Zalaria obscura TaxID=2024903 RepID=A0ACC3SHD7_9PEZI